MSIGLGIFLSALALIAAWQIGKFGAWRKAGRVALWCAVSVIILSALSGGWYLWQSRRTNAEKRAEIDKVVTGQIYEYMRIKLGMTQNELLYVKGEPTERVEPSGDAGPSWIYRTPGAETRLGPFWDDNRVTSIVCALGPVYGCDMVAGVGLEMPEDDVRHILGVPRHDEPPDSNGIKYLTYGTDAREFKFLLRQGKVFGIVLHVTPKNKSKTQTGDAPNSSVK